MDVYVARQPIFDRNKKIFAYELLFRDGLSNCFPEIEGDVATSKLLTTSFLTIGIDRLSNGKMVFINFTKELLARKIPTMFPKEKIMVEILETIEPEEEVVKACRDIAHKGYQIALDDFLYKTELEELIALAKIIKIDFKLLPIEEIKKLLDKLADNQVKLLAEKIETYEEFKVALDMGFTYFQGYFFSKPEILKSKEIATSKLHFLHIISEVNKEENYSLEKLENLINRDVSISYKLLRYINSVFFGRIQYISSIRQAIVLLGQKEIGKFILLVATAELACEKPAELIRTSIIRARFCELLGMNSESNRHSELFLLGLFSLIDAMLDNRMEKIMEKLPLSESIKLALVKGKGELSDYLKIASSYEAGSWKECSILASNIGVNKDKIPGYYIEAVSWADAYPVF